MDYKPHFFGRQQTQEVSYTLQNVKDACFVNGVPEINAESYYNKYGAVGFVDGCNRPIRNLALHIKNVWDGKKWVWENNKEKKKTRLPIIIGKTCSVKGCKMPAVYKDTSGSYDHYKCHDHLPEKVKEQYE